MDRFELPVIVVNVLANIHMLSVAMFEQWKGSSHGVKDNLEEDIEEEYVMNPLLFNNLIDYLDEEHVQRGSTKPSRKSNNDRLALYYTKLFYNDYLSRTIIFDDASFHKV